MSEELTIREIRIDEAADSRLTSFEVIMSLKFQSTKISIYRPLYLRPNKLSVALYNIYTLYEMVKIVIHQLKKMSYQTNI